MPSECQTVWAKIKSDVLSGLILAQTVCIGYQQLGDKSDCQAKKVFSYTYSDPRNLLFGWASIYYHILFVSSKHSGMTASMHRLVWAFLCADSYPRGMGGGVLGYL